MRDLALLGFVYFLEILKVPLARSVFTSLVIYNVFTEIVDDLTYKVTEPNPRHIRNWKIVQENNIHYELLRIYEKIDAFNDHSGGGGDAVLGTEVQEKNR